ncbi:hypothetical protein [Nocardia sp. NPDC051463]|uniref:hypothetical protein n=1 Tax=Nocardia sp. NPDC051463 TaxID=3154845 RepID=UPI00341896F7
MSGICDGEFDWATVVEVTPRWDTPVTHLSMRFATDRIALADMVIPKGEGVVRSVRLADTAAERVSGLLYTVDLSAKVMARQYKSGSRRTRR